MWQLWLAKDFEDKSFKEFKERNLKQITPAKAITPEEEAKIYSFTDQFIKPKKGGETNK